MLRALRHPLLGLLVFLLGFLVAPSAVGQPTAEPAGKRYALVVGVNEYNHPDLPTLKAAENDAIVLGSELRHLGYEVTLLTGKNATKTAIEEQLKKVGDKAAPGGRDLLLVALSGHGMQFADQDEAFFCPVNARPIKERLDTLVAMGTVYNALKASNAGAKVLFVDACRNDPGVRGRSGIEASSAPVPEGVVAMFACARGQKACEDDENHHGVFIHCVLKGLRGEAPRNSSGELSFLGLAEYVRDAVESRAKALKGQPAQTPEVVARFTGRAILVPRLDPEAPAGDTASAPADDSLWILYSLLGASVILVPFGVMIYLKERKRRAESDFFESV